MTDGRRRTSDWKCLLIEDLIGPDREVFALILIHQGV